MRRLATATVLLLAVFAVRCSSCGQKSCNNAGGGIVDNGDHKDPEPTPSNAPDDKTPTGYPLEGESLRPNSILDTYVVDLPTEDWKYDRDDATFSLKDPSRTVTFSAGIWRCAVPHVKTEHAIDLYRCSPTRTVLVDDEDNVVVAEHSKRTADIDLLLASFRRIDREE